MRQFWFAVVYTSLTFGANTAIADISGLAELREGSMKKLVFHADPVEASSEIFVTLKVTNRHWTITRASTFS